MTFEEYIGQVSADAIEAIERGEYDNLSDIDDVIDGMWVDDSITGNGSGSYTFNAQQAVEYVGELLFDDDFAEECECACIDMGDLLKKGAEAVDVTARCLALPYAIDDIEAAWDSRRADELADK